MADLPPGFYINVLGGLLVAGLGAFVMYAGRGAVGARRFGLAMALFGLAFIPSNLVIFQGGGDYASGGGLVFGVMLAATGTLLLAAMPGLTGSSRKMQWTSIGLVAAFYLVMAGTAAATNDWIRIATSVTAIGVGGFTALSIALALRYNHAAPPDARRYALLAVGLAWFYLFQGGFFLVVIAQGLMTAVDHVQQAGWTLGMLATTGIWLHNTRRDRTGASLWVALAIPTMFLLGMAAAAFYRAADSDFGSGGITRAAAAMLLTYGILRHQMLGIDAKLRFGISRGTLAGIFVAVIFVVSEGAQILFGEDQQWFGLAAGAGLVFALAPLSRFADGVAEKAVPPDMPPSDSGPVAVYRRQLELALADGVLATKERRMLRRLRADLDISAATAAALETEVEAD